MPSVLIATPTTGTTKAANTRALVAMIFDLQSNKINAGYISSDGGDVVVLRNELAQDPASRTLGMGCRFQAGTIRTN